MTTSDLKNSIQTTDGNAQADAQLKQAMEERHTVRKFTDQPIAPALIEKLEQRAAMVDQKYGLQIRLVTKDKALLPGVIRLFLAKNADNAFIIAGPQGSDELCGYASADLMLYAQSLGLNTWYIGGTYSRKEAEKDADGAHVVGIIVVGYGQNQGTPHKSKTPDEVSRYEGDEPEWFKNGVKAALLAPTALNKQAFFLNGKGNEVSIQCNNGIFTDVDTGLVKYHFELGAGKNHFKWK